jgi:L-fuconolactonase
MSGLFMPVLGHDFHTQKRLASKQELVERAAPVIQHTLDCFGSGRVMFASNFPMDSVSSSLTNIIDAFSDIVQDYNENALKSIFYENAKRFYRL